MKKVCKCKRAYENPLSEICSFCWNELYPNDKDKIKDEDLLESKQETIEQAAKRLTENAYQNEEWETGRLKRIGYYQGIIEGVKWQAERMYSEEDLRKAIQLARLCTLDGDISDFIDISGLTEVCTYGLEETHSEDSIIEQFKKK